MNELVKDLTEEEKSGLEKWIQLNVGPLESLAMSVRDLASTENSAEMLLDAINHIFSEEGNEEFEKCLEKS